jgi:hypothetical protein
MELFFFFSLKKKERKRKEWIPLNTCRYVSASFQTTPISFRYKARKGEQKTIGERWMPTLLRSWLHKKK